jgi:hypothetical protein
MKSFRILGGLLALYGAVMLVLLATPARQWALEHSIAHLVSRTDRRVGNTVDGAIDMPLALAGSAVLLFAGVWFGLYLPRVFRRSEGAMRAVIEANMPPTPAAPLISMTQPVPPPPVPGQLR